MLLLQLRSSEQVKEEDSGSHLYDKDTGRTYSAACHHVPKLRSQNSPLQVRFSCAPLPEGASLGSSPCSGAHHGPAACTPGFPKIEELIGSYGYYPLTACVSLLFSRNSCVCRQVRGPAAGSSGCLDAGGRVQAKTSEKGKAGLHMRVSEHRGP